MPVADAAVALVEELVARNVVFRNVPFDEVEVPCEEWVQLEETGAVNLEGLKVGAVSTLRCAAASDHGLDTEFFVCSPRRLNLFRQCVIIIFNMMEIVVSTYLDCEIIKFLIPLPELLAVLFLKVLNSFAPLGLVDSHRDVVPLFHLLHEIVCLLEVVEGIDEDERGRGGGDLRQHVDGDEASQTKGSCLEETGDVFDSPFEDVLGCLLAEVVVDLVEDLLGERKLEGLLEYWGLWGTRDGHG
jgi:hypothetical protein